MLRQYHDIERRRADPKSGDGAKLHDIRYAHGEGQKGTPMTEFPAPVIDNRDRHPVRESWPLVLIMVRADRRIG
jgi:hypothetical protein